MALPKSLERFIDSNVILNFGENSLIYVDDQEEAILVYSRDTKPNPHWFGTIGICFSFQMDLNSRVSRRKRIGRYFGIGGHDRIDNSICDLTLTDNVSGDKFRYKVHMITKHPPVNISSLKPVESAEYNERVKEYKKRFSKIIV